MRAEPQPRRVRIRAGDEDGQIMLLSIVYGLVTLALVLVVASVSHLHIERKRLWNLADSLAAGAADATDVGRWYDTGGTDGLVLTDASVSEAVGDQLAATPEVVADSFIDFRVVSVSAVDDQTVEVILSARARPPLVPWVLVPWQDGFTVEVTSRAHATEP
ncbi:pilus assembly protein TadG-related protein [Pseudactinotalea sp. Z1748]|uniref:pilus assembly protein TadG-related protein n=1 Tax=Pseudactinotalea sp. Z1748 TaxID=3413027 RepID=UPI003C7DF785